MSAIESRRLETPHGAILCDARLAADITPVWFEPDYWRGLGALSCVEGGRGGAGFVQTPHGPMVLRRYLRGGMAARFSRESYLFTGERRARSFAEFGMLADLAASGLAVPMPRAACYWRRGPVYRAAILVERIEDARPLPSLFDELTDTTFSAVGVAIADLHRRGVWHADLNAHNILVDRTGRVWLIDFDRARVRGRERARHWEQANLERLHRSLVKLNAPLRVAGFDTGWQALVSAHAQRLAGDAGEPA